MYPLHQIDFTNHLFQKPVAIIRPQLWNILSHGKNHCLKETNFPQLTALDVGCRVMLLKNYTVEHNLMNGAIGTVVEIVYSTSLGPNDSNVHCSLPQYVIVNFSQSKIPDTDKMFPDAPSIYISIAPYKQLCKKSSFAKKWSILIVMYP